MDDRKSMKISSIHEGILSDLAVAAATSGMNLHGAKKHEKVFPRHRNFEACKVDSQKMLSDVHDKLNEFSSVLSALRQVEMSSQETMSKLLSGIEECVKETKDTYWTIGYLFDNINARKGTKLIGIGDLMTNAIIDRLEMILGNLKPIKSGLDSSKEEMIKNGEKDLSPQLLMAFEKQVVETINIMEITAKEIQALDSQHQIGMEAINKLIADEPEIATIFNNIYSSSIKHPNAYRNKIKALMLQELEIKAEKDGTLNPSDANALKTFKSSIGIRVSRFLSRLKDSGCLIGSETGEIVI